jgi:hypothetical protein
MYNIFHEYIIRNAFPNGWLEEASHYEGLIEAQDSPRGI